MQRFYITVSMIGKAMVLEVVPDPLVRIQFRSIRREVLDRQSRMPLYEFFHEFTSVSLTSIPDQNHRAANMLKELAHKGRNVVSINAMIRKETKKEIQSVTLGGDADCRDRGDFSSPTSDMLQRGGLSAWCPGSTDNRKQREPAFVGKYDVCVRSTSFFLSEPNPV